MVTLGQGCDNMKYPKEIIRSSKIIYIPRNSYNRMDNPIPYKDKPFFFKDIESLDKYFNELLGSLLAPKFDLKTVKYSLDCIELPNDTIYGLISPSFLRNKKYVLSDEIIGTRKVPNGISNLESITTFFKHNEDYERFILELLKMTVLDFYMNQIDRVKENFHIIEEKNKLSLAPLYDYSESFNSIYDDSTYDYAFYYPINRGSKSYIYANAIMKLEFPSQELYTLFERYPLFKSYFERILDIDMEELLNKIRKKYDIETPRCLEKHYLDYDKEKKEFVKSLL